MLSLRNLLFTAAIGIAASQGRPTQAQDVSNLGISAALRSVSVDSVALPLIADPSIAGFDSPTRAALQAARLRYDRRRSERRLKTSRLRQARLERSFRPTFNPGFYIPSMVGHLQTRYGFVTGPALGRTF